MSKTRMRTAVARLTWTIGGCTALLALCGSGKIARAVEQHNEIPAFVERAADPGEAGWAAYQAGRHAEAAPLLERALTEAEVRFGVDDPKVAPALMRLGVLYRTQARYRDAERVLLRALTIRETRLGPEHPTVATTLDSLAHVYRELGRYRDAEAALERALAIRESKLGPAHPDVATVLVSLARIKHTTARVEEAEPLFRRALEIRERTLGRSHPDFANALGNLAKTYEELGRHAEAEQFYKRALASAEAALGPDDRYVAALAHNLAKFYRDVDRFAEAEPLFRRALRFRERHYGLDHPEVAFIANDLGELLHYAGRYDEAEVLLRRALATQERVLGPEHRSTATVLHSLGRMYTDQGRFEEAETLLTSATAVREKALGPEHRAVAVALGNLAKLYQRQGRLDRAMAAIRRAVLIEEKRAAAYDQVEQATARWSRRIALPRYIRIGWDLAGAEPSRRAEAVDETFRIGQSLQATSAATAVARVAARFAAGEDELARLVRQRQDKADEVRSLDAAALEALALDTAESRDETARLRRRLESAEAELAALDGGLRERFPAYAELAKPEALSIAAAQELLAPDELLLAYAMLAENPSGREPGEAYLWAVRRDQAAMHKLAIKPDELDATVRELRDQLDPGRWPSGLPPRFDLAAAHRLFEVLLPLEDSFVEGVRHILVVPHGPLESLPLSVLVQSAPAAGAHYRDADWLARSWATTTLPSVSSLRALRHFASRSRASQPFRGVGDPVLAGPPASQRGITLANAFTARGLADPATIRELPPLPESAVELRALASSLGAGQDSLLLRETATEAAVKAGAVAGARIVAFATHAGIAGELPGLAEPALVLSPPATATPQDDGLLTASEAAQLSLDADLVLLSACNTAAPDGTPGAPGLSGLARAFIYAGSRSLLVSHWYVDTEAAQRLTTGMFAELQREPGLGRSEALRRSMLALIASDERPYFPHPAAWAPFIIVGEGSAGF